MSGRKKNSKGDAGEAPKKPRRWYLRKRRILIWATVAVLLGLYGGFEYISDPARLRRVAEEQLSKLLDAKVTVAAAELTMLGDLTLGDVTVTLTPGKSPEDRVLVVRQLDVDVNIPSLLRAAPSRDVSGVRMNRIAASGVRLNVCDNEDQRRWNVQRLLPRDHEGPTRPTTGQSPMLGLQNLPALPDVQLNGIQLVFSHVRGGQYAENPAIQLDGGLHPIGRSKCSFELLGRGAGDASSRQLAVMSGMIDLKSGQVNAQLRQVDFDQGMLRVLPRTVRRWCEEHQLRGVVRIPSLVYSPSTGGTYGFKVRVEFDKLGFIVQPRYWLSRQETRKLEMVQSSLQVLGILDMNRWPTAATGGDQAPLVPVRMVDYLAQRLAPVPVRLDGVAGAIVFTDQGIDIERLQGEFEGNEMVVTGRLDGYDPLSGYAPDGPAKFHISSGPGKRLRIPPTPGFMTWMPEDVRNIYSQFVPVGYCTLDVVVTRPTAGADVESIITVDVDHTAFTYDEFAYPLEDCRGRFVFGLEPGTGIKKLTIEHLRGHGVTGGPNEKSFIEVNGKIGPFIKHGIGVDVLVAGKSISSEPTLRKAFPDDVKEAFEIFGPVDYARRRQQTGVNEPPLTVAEQIEWPRFNADFTAHVQREAGVGNRTVTDIRIDVLHAWGSLRTFPYPLEDISGNLRIYKGVLTLSDVHMKRNGATLRMDGDIAFGDPAKPDLKLKATDAPIDDDLLGAMPATERSWLVRSGLQGAINIDGRIFFSEEQRSRGHDTDFDLGITLRGGSIHTKDRPLTIDPLAGEFRLHPARLELKQATGRRGDADLQGKGDIAWPEGDVSLKMHLEAKKLLLDMPLYNLLPEDAKAAWRQQKPEGTADIILDYAGHVRSPDAGPTTRIATSQPVTAGAAAPPNSIRLEVTPRGLTVTPEVFPLRLTALGGKVVFADGELQLQDLTARRGDARVRVSGAGKTGERSDFTLKIDAEALQLDKALLKACPEAVGGILSGLGAAGPVDLHLSSLRVRDTDPGRLPAFEQHRVMASTQATTRPVDVDFEGAIGLTGTKFDVGLPVTDVQGELAIKGAVVASRLSAFSSDASIASYRVSGIAGGPLTAHAAKAPALDRIYIENIRTGLADGVLAGAFTIDWYDRANSRYAADLVLKDASLKQLMPGEQAFGDARMSASLRADGELSSKGYRRGGGYMRVDGKKMYKVPLLLGLVQMVDLALPITEPMNQVSTDYVLENSKIRIENMEMRSPTTIIRATGTVDLSTRRLDLILTTDSPQKITIPVWSKLMADLKKELFQIRMQGSLQEPKVSTLPLPTLRATIDQVFPADKTEKTEKPPAK